MKIKSRLFKALQITAIFSVIALIGFSMTACDPENGGGDTTVNLTITNNTGYQINKLQVSLSTDSSWGTNKLGDSEFINNSQSKILNINPGTYDIRITDSDLDTYTIMDVNVSSNSTVTFTNSDIDSAAVTGILKVINGIPSEISEGEIKNIKVLTTTDETVQTQAFDIFNYNQYHDFTLPSGTYKLIVTYYHNDYGQHLDWKKKTNVIVRRGKTTTVSFSLGSDWE